MSDKPRVAWPPEDSWPKWQDQWMALPESRREEVCWSHESQHQGDHDLAAAIVDYAGRHRLWGEAAIRRACRRVLRANGMDGYLDEQEQAAFGGMLIAELEKGP